MGGQPQLRAFCRKIEEMGGDDVILDLIAAAVPLREMGKRFDCSPAMFYRWRDKGGAERKEAWKQARAIAGHMVMEEGMEILDDGKPVTAADAALLKSRAEYRKHLASLWNREELGDRDVNVNMNPGDGWKELADTIAGNLQRLSAPKTQDADYEILEADEDDDTLRLEGSGGSEE